MERVLDQGCSGQCLSIMREHEHKVVEGAKDAAVLRPGVRETSHLVLFILDEARVDAEPEQHFADRCSQARRQGFDSLRRQHNREERPLTDAQDKLLRPREQDVGVPIAENRGRGMRLLRVPKAPQ
jgi:hypothetical protein